MYIAKVMFRNCQSLGNVTYEFSPGLNVIVAPDNDGNSTGKSVLYKCLRTAVGAVFFDASELKHLISYGEKAASALFVLSDGSAGGFLAAERNIIYLHRKDANSEIDRLNSPHPEFIAKMSIIMDKKNNFVLNILDMDQELLFVTSREDTNFSLLQLVSDNETLEELIPAVEERIADTKAYLSKANQLNIEVKRKLNTLERHDIASLEDQLQMGEQFIPILRNLLTLKENIDALCPVEVRDFNSIEQLFEILKLFASLYSDLDSFKPLELKDFAAIEGLLNYVLIYSGLVESFDKITIFTQTDFALANRISAFLSGLIKINDSLSRIKIFKPVNFASVENLFALLDVMAKVRASLGVVKPFVPIDTGSALGLADYVERLTSLTEHVSAYTDVYVKLDAINSDIAAIQGEIRSLGAEVDCPVRGKVCYFDEGCVDACAISTEQAS